MDASAQLTRQVKDLAGAAGFAAVGVAPADAVVGEKAFRDWLALGRHGQMAYLERNISMRFHPAELVKGARSVLCLAVSYAPRQREDDDAGVPFVARYARGRDYHRVLRKRCHRLMDELRRIRPDFAGRAFVDSAPLAERSLAAAAGVGWIGRNGCLIVPGAGSYVVLCEIVSNLPLLPDAPLASACGDCDACVTACPTGACLGDATLDCRRCLSYLSIEHRGEIPADLRGAWGRRLFGCDDCQAACPHNLAAPAGDVELAVPPGAPAKLAEILRWTAEEWDRATRASVRRRADYRSTLRNAVLAAAGDETLRAALLALRDGRSELAGLIDWSLAAAGSIDRGAGGGV